MAARAARAARQAAYERVRSAVLASRSTDDILRVSSLMEQELRGLGVSLSGAGINLIDEGAGEFRQFAASELGGLEQPASPGAPLVDQVVEHWRRSEVYQLRPPDRRLPVVLTLCPGLVCRAGRIGGGSVWGRGRRGVSGGGVGGGALA